MSKESRTDYYRVTEHPGEKASLEQIERLYHRYHFAREYVKGMDILELACGSGIGLGFLAEVARSVLAGDKDLKNLEIAMQQYKNSEKIKVCKIDAHNIPFSGESFDVVLLLEAIYYLEEPERFIKEARRILRKNGTLIICTVNKDWKEFHPSIYSYNYYSVPELYRLLKGGFETVDLYGAFFVGKNEGIKAKTLSELKRMASKANMIPGSLRARAILKRVFFGRLCPIPEQIHEGLCEYEAPILLSQEAATDEYKIIYAVAKK